MKYNVISYLIGEGIRNVFKNKKSTISAFTIMCLCMLVFGIFFVVSENVNHIMNTVEDAQGMNVYIKVGTSEERVEEIGRKLKEVEGVNKVEYTSAEEGLDIIKETMKDTQGAIEAIPSEAIPESYKITLTDLSLNKSVQDTITRNSRRRFR